MSSPGSDFVVGHDATGHRFEVEIQGALAVLEYDREGQALTIRQTFVPPEGRGMGIAERLTKAALGFAREEGLRVVPACSYAARFIEKNPDYRDLL